MLPSSNCVNPRCSHFHSRKAVMYSAPTPDQISFHSEYGKLDITNALRRNSDILTLAAIFKSAFATGMVARLNGLIREVEATFFRKKLDIRPELRARLREDLIGIDLNREGLRLFPIPANDRGDRDLVVSIDGRRPGYIDEVLFNILFFWS